MATLKLTKKPSGTGRRTSRPPVRGTASSLRPRPTLAEKEAQRKARPSGDADRSEAKRRPPREQAPAGHPAAQECPPPGRPPGGGPPPPPPGACPGNPPISPRARPAVPQPASPRAATPRPPAPPSSSGGNTAFAPRARPAAAAQPAAHGAAAPRPPGRGERPTPAASAVPPPGQRPPTRPAGPELRLSKRMSELGMASRREADEWIAKGWVRVDGQVVNELGSRVRPDQLITVDTPAKFQQARKVTVLLNKPIGYVSGQAEDGHEPAWVLIKPENQWRQDSSGIRFRREHTRGLAPAGRLDLDSVGLLVMTQDGRVAKQLIGEDSEIDKEYLVQVAPSQPGQALSDEGLARLNHGLSLDGVELKPAQVDWVEKDRVLRFVLREGRKRQIRRMCEAVGLQVVSLQRVRIGQVTLGDLPPGQWRYLRLDEGFAH